MYICLICEFSNIKYILNIKFSFRCHILIIFIYDVKALLTILISFKIIEIDLIKTAILQKIFPSFLVIELISYLCSIRLKIFIMCKIEYSKTRGYIVLYSVKYFHLHEQESWFDFALHWQYI